MRHPLLCSRALLLCVLMMVLPAWKASGQDTTGYKQLEWGDFQGPVPSGTQFSAETWSGIEGSWEGTVKLKKEGTGQYRAGLKNPKAKSKFDKKKSWSKPADRTPELLKHEQYHLDISEYWAKELEKKLKEVKGKGRNPDEAAADAEKQGEAAKADCEKKRQEMQEKYDKETDHGRNADKQKEWCTTIGNLLSPPPAPPTTGGKTGKSKMNYNPLNKQISFDPLIVTSSFVGGTSFVDSTLAGAQITLPPMSYRGYYMYYSTPMFMPVNPDDCTVTILKDGDAIGKGNLRLAMWPDGTLVLGGYFEGLAFNEGLERTSRTIASMSGDAITQPPYTQLRIEMETSLKAATGYWKNAASVPVTVSFGITNGWPANPPLFGPDDAGVAVGDRLTLHVLAATSSDVQFTWYHNGELVSDDDRKSGSRTDTLRVEPALPGDDGVYTVVVTGPCGESTSREAAVVISCGGDFDRSGSIDEHDLDAFMEAFEAGDASADIDTSGYVDSDDFTRFIVLLERSC